MKKTFTANADGSITVRDFPDDADTTKIDQSIGQLDIDAQQVPLHRRDQAFDAELRAALPEYAAAIDVAAALVGE